MIVTDSAIDFEGYVPAQVVNVFLFVRILLIYLGPIVLLVCLYEVYKNRKKAYLLLFWLVVIFSVFHLLWPLTLPPRYLVFLAPVVGLFVGNFLVNNWKKKRQLVALVIVLQLLFTVAVVVGKHEARKVENSATAYIDGAKWVKENSGEDDTVLSIGFPQAGIAFYSERWTETMRFAGDTLPEKDPDFVLVSDNYECDESLDETARNLLEEYELVTSFEAEYFRTEVYKRE